MKKSVLLRLFLLLVAGLVPVSEASASIGGHKVQVRDAAATQGVIAQGGRLIADYGGFQVYDVPQINGNLPGSAKVRDEYNSILLNAAHLDTSMAAVQALRKSAGAFAGKRMHLVQFAGPVQPDWREALLDAGVEIVSYIPQNAYLVYGDAASIGRVQAMAATAPHVQWEGAYLDDYKIHPRARAVDKNGHPRQVGTDRFAIQLMADAAANADTLKLIDQLKLAPVERQRPVLNFVDVVVRLSAADLPKVAARPDVLSIQPFSPPKKVCERQDQIAAGNLSDNVPTGPGYMQWLANKGFSQAQFTASGFVVDLSDSGIDNGTTTPNHFGLYVGGVSSDPSRVVYNILEGTPNSGSTVAGCDGHGNLNAHIIMGYDNGGGFPFADKEGYHYGLGVCPFVSVGSSVIFDPDNSTNPNDATVISTAYQHGARISNNSWGDSDPSDDGTYNIDAQEYDSLVRTAEPGVSGDHEMVIVFAAGNDGPQANSISPPGTAKNIITVGAAQNVQAFGGCDLSGVCDSGADNANAIISFSGRGPCDDGRLKPDLMAPGTHVSGGAPEAANPGPDGTGLACFLDISTADIGVSGGVGTNGQVNRFFPNGQQFYTASSGTSHSTPCVSVGCALLRQYFINNSSTPPSAAMTKAYLMNSTRYMTGSGADDTLWSDSQGMGEMDLGTAFDGTPRILRDEASADMFTASGQTRVFAGIVGDPTKPFRVTLAWSDAPGNTTGHAYNNDLDLAVTVGGNTYLGNVFSGSNSIPGGAPDTMNNVESVFLPPGVFGSFTVTITAANINSIGVPTGGNTANQDFALVVYNVGPAATLIPAGYTLTNELCNTGAVYPGETVTVNLALQNVGSAATTNLVATLLPYLVYRDETAPGVIGQSNVLASLLASNETAFPSGPQTFGVVPVSATATNTFSFFADGTCGQTITAVLQLQDGTADLGTISYSFQLGQPVSLTNFSENFDSNATPPALPTGWSTGTSGGGDLTAWTTTTSSNNTPPNAAFCPDSSSMGEVFLVSPTIPIPAGTNQLSFANGFNLEGTYDGGVLDISINGGAFADILAAGGSFVTGGYNGTITDTEDSPSQDNPLIGRQAWTGNSGGFETTLVNLPAAASGKNIQLQWICGTDSGNGTTVVGWWIDSVSISQPGIDCTNCAGLPTNVSAPTMVFPTNGYQFTTFSPVVVVTGQAPVGSSVIISNNGISNLTVRADGNGIYAALATLNFCTNILTTSGTTNTNVINLAPPILQVPPVANPKVAFSGTGAVGATVDLYNSANETLLLSFVITNASGNFSNTVTLPLGDFTLTAPETVPCQTSSNSVPASVSVVPVPPPTILLPTNGLVTEKAAQTISGKGVAGAVVTIFDITNRYAIAVTNTLATANVNHGGRFSVTAKLSDGTNTLFATQEQNSTNSPPSAPVVVTDYLIPRILYEPQNQTNFLKGSVTFSADVVGAAPLRIIWRKNGVKIPGAASPKLTLSNIRASDATNYSLTASNAYGAVESAVVTLTLVTNPFPTLTGAYYGLFAESNVQFDSSGLLTLNLTDLGRFTARILSAGGSYSFSGGLSGVGWWSNLVSRGAALAPLTVVLDMNLTNAQIGGVSNVSSVANGTNWNAGLQVDRATFSRANPSTNQGEFTLLFGSTNNGAHGPGGDGYATVNVSAEGMASLRGVLADNTSVAPGAVSVSTNGRWPLYIPLYGRFGSLVSWIYFTNQGANITNLTSLSSNTNTNTNMSVCSFAGSNSMWFRTNADGKIYPGGFTNALTIVGSTFAPNNNETLLGLPNLKVILSGGDLTEVFSNSASASGNSQFAPAGAGIPGLSLSLDPATGVIKGSFDDPAVARPAPIKGVIFQEQTNAGGFFLGSTNSGSFLLTPP